MPRWGLLAGRAIASSARAGARLGAELERATRDAGRRWRVRTGVLAPGDSSPAPGDLKDHYDYRGVVNWGRRVPGADGPFRLGRYLHPRRGPGQAVGLDRHDLNHHAAVVGPTGCGKTTSIVIPWVAAAVAQGAFVVTVDVKGSGASDALVPLLGEEFDRRSLSQSLLATWDYTRADSLTWNPLDELVDDRAFEVATKSLLGQSPKDEHDKYFYERDYRWLRAILHIACETGLSSLADVNRAISSRDRFMSFAATSTSRWADDVEDLRSFDAYDFARAVPGLINKMHVFTQPGVAAICGRGRLEPSVGGAEGTLRGSLIAGRGSSGSLRFGSSRASASRSTEPSERPNLNLLLASSKAGVVVVGAPISDGELSASLSALFLSQITNIFLKHGARAPGGAFLIIDEAPRLTDRLDYETLVSICRSVGVGVTLVMQDVAHFRDEDERSAILTNCRNVIVCPGVSRATTKYLQERLGERMETSVSTAPSVGRAGKGRVDLSHSLGSVSVIGHREIAYPPFGPRTAVVCAERFGGRPMLVDLSLS